MPIGMRAFDLGFLGHGGHRVEADVGNKDSARATEDAKDATVVVDDALRRR